jgi:hypothetical protein
MEAIKTEHYMTTQYNGTHRNIITDSIQKQGKRKHFA